MYNYKNYSSVNPDKAASQNNWCLSAGTTSKYKQATVNYSDGSSSQYASRDVIKEGDVAVIGYPIKNSYTYRVAKDTGKMGTISEVLPKLEIGKSKAAETQFVFTNNVTKATIKACTDCLCAEDSSIPFLGSVVHPISFLIRHMLAAISIVAYENLASDEAIAKAKEYILQKQCADVEVFNSYDEASIHADMDIRDIHVDLNGENEQELLEKGISGMEEDGYSYDDEFYNYTHCLIDEEYINKYTYIGTVSLLVRGGFVNLLKAFLSVEPPIKYFFSEMLDAIGEIGNPEALEIIKEYQPTNAVAKTKKICLDIPEGTSEIDYTVIPSDGIMRGYIENVTMPESVTTLGYRAFSGCIHLTEIVLPKNLAVIEEFAFEECFRLTHIEIPESVTTIKNRAFDSCISLTNVEIAEGVTEIGDYAFWSCDALKTIVIPKSVTKIGDNAFPPETVVIRE